MASGCAVGLLGDPTQAPCVTAPPLPPACQDPYQSPYLRNLSWIEPEWAQNVSLYCHKDLSACERLEHNCGVRVVVDVFVLVPLCVAGLLGNGLAFLVLKWDSLNVAVSMQLQALAIMDNLYLLCCVWYQTLHTIADCTGWSPALTRNFGLAEAYMWPFASIFHTCTVWMVAMITIDRYFAICRPFHTKILATPGRVKKAVAVIVLAAILYNVPRFFEYSTAYSPFLCQQSMRHHAVKTALRKHRLYYIIYKTCCYFAFRIVIPFTILITLNTSLIRRVHNIYRDQATLTQNQGQRNHDHFSLLLVSMVTAFIIFEIPDVVVRFLSMVRQFAGLRVDVTYAAVFTNLLLAFNSSINCVIYCLVARRFRKVLHRHVVRLCSSTYRQRSFSSMNSTQLRPDTSHEMLRLTTCANEQDGSHVVRACRANNTSGKTGSEVLVNSNGINVKDASAL